MVIADPNASPIRRYQDLRVWQLSMDLVVEIYRASETFPKRETYGLSAQCRRAAVSLPSNIAEGHGRKHLGDYLHHLSIANGSLMELETQILIAGRMGFVQPEERASLLQQTSDVGRMLAGLIAALKRRRVK